MPQHSAKTLISAALAAVVALGAFVNVACDTKKVDRFIFAVEATQDLPAAFGVTGESARLVSDGFAAVATAGKNFRDGKGTWQNLVATFREVQGRASWQRLPADLRARVGAVFNVAERILSSIQPAGTAAEEGGPLPKPNFKHVDGRDLEELERLTGRR
jgi:hypothetical protein